MAKTLWVEELFFFFDFFILLLLLQGLLFFPSFFFFWFFVFLSSSSSSRRSCSCCFCRGNVNTQSDVGLANLWSASPKKKEPIRPYQIYNLVLLFGRFFYFGPFLRSFFSPRPLKINWHSIITWFWNWNFQREKVFMLSLSLLMLCINDFIIREQTHRQQPKQRNSILFCLYIICIHVCT